MRCVFAELLEPGAFTGRPAGWALTVTRWCSGAVFVTFGAGKFVNHASEANSFQTYGLPSPSAFAYAIGVVELVGGTLLLAGLRTRLTALLLAGDMIGAIVVSGAFRGETISLTLAPALLLAMAVLAVLGPGRISLDARLERRGGASRPGGAVTEPELRRRFVADPARTSLPCPAKQARTSRCPSEKPT